LLARFRTPSALALGAALVLVALYFVVRSPPPIETSRVVVTTWTLLACALAVVSPRAGLVVLVAIGPFHEIALFNEFLRAKTLIATALLGGVAVRAAYAYAVRRRVRLTAVADGAATAGAAPRAPDRDAARTTWSPTAERIFGRLAPLADPRAVLGLAAVVVIGTGLSLWLVSLPLGEPFGSRASTAWGGGIWTPFAAMFAAAWLGWRGDRTILVVTAIVGTICAAIGLVAMQRPDVFASTPFAWVVERARAGPRLVGVIDVPNAAATIFLAPAILTLCAVIFVRDLRVRLLAAVSALVLLGATYLTLSRSALLAIALAAVVVAWRLDRRLGGAFLVAGVLAVAVLLPRYLDQRNEAQPTGGDAAVALGDASRVRAWNAAVLMWRDAPVTGQGFRVYQLRHADYGEPLISAPHNEWLRFFAEEGTVIGLAALGFLACASLALARPRTWISSAILGTLLAYAVMASVNNPLTYVQVGLMVFPVIGVGLGLAWAARAGPSVRRATGLPGAPSPGSSAA
jgi:hypothetical protein